MKKICTILSNRGDAHFAGDTDKTNWEMLTGLDLDHETRRRLARERGENVYRHEVLKT